MSALKPYRIRDRTKKVSYEASRNTPTLDKYNEEEICRKRLKELCDKIDKIKEQRDINSITKWRDLSRAYYVMRIKWKEQDIEREEEEEEKKFTKGSETTTNTAQ